MGTGLMKVEEQPAEIVLLNRADELQVYTSALERRLVMNGGVQPLSEYPPDMCKAMLRGVLEFAFKDMDLKSSPVEYDVDRMIDYLGTNHPKFTASDVKSAFEMWLAGRFDDKLPERFDHYQAFSVKFYGKILRCYVKAQQEARYNVRHKVEKATLLLAAPDIPREVNEYRSLHIIREQVSAYIAHGSTRIVAVGYTHDYLVRLGICQPVEDPTPAEKREALDELRKKKGPAVAYTWNLQRILAGERVNDIEWAAMVKKRTAALFTELGEHGQRALHIIDVELQRLKAKAKASGFEVDQQETAAA